MGSWSLMLRPTHLVWGTVTSAYQMWWSGSWNVNRVCKQSHQVFPLSTWHLAISITVLHDLKIEMLFNSSAAWSSACVCVVCVWERQRECVCVCVSECKRVCVCVCVHGQSLWFWLPLGLVGFKGFSASGVLNLKKQKPLVIKIISCYIIHSRIGHFKWTSVTLFLICVIFFLSVCCCCF